MQTAPTRWEAARRWGKVDHLHPPSPTKYNHSHPYTHTPQTVPYTYFTHPELGARSFSSGRKCTAMSPLSLSLSSPSPCPRPCPRELQAWWEEQPLVSGILPKTSFSFIYLTCHPSSLSFVFGFLIPDVGPSLVYVLVWVPPGAEPEPLGGLGSAGDLGRSITQERKADNCALWGQPPQGWLDHYSARKL